MLKKISIPPSFSLTKRGKTHLLLHDDFKELLLKRGVEDPETLVTDPLQPVTFLTGRTPHPVIPFQEGFRVVLRKYSHGGLLRFLTRDLFLLGARSFKELALIEEIRTAKIPTIQPIGAIHRVIRGPFYRAYLLSLEVAGAKNLIDYLREMGSGASPEALRQKRRVIRSAGLLLRQFHQKGFYHGDLQLKNLLVAGDRVLVIDLDRSYRKKELSLGIQIENLLRLNRSAEKWRRLGLPLTRTDRYRFFTAYADKDLHLRKAMRKALRTYPLRLALHRAGWFFRWRVGILGESSWTKGSPNGESP